ncbi:hypothetical protein [Arsenicicoccus dermatophilus]|uniref:hypothetical protein n=1 Tax=Arsenicicoccus dermatophilus TaxID=1076331 RepID=UPI0039171F0C
MTGNPPEDRPAQGVLDARAAGQVAELVDEVVKLVDTREVQATAPERAYLAGVSATLRTQAAGPRA